MTETTLSELQQRIAQTPCNRRGRRRYDEPLRQQVCSYGHVCCGRGERVEAVARRLGMSERTLEKWLSATAPAAAAPGPAAVPAAQALVRRVATEIPPAMPAEAAPRGPTVVMPSGMRIEGLGVAEVLWLARELGQ